MNDSFTNVEVVAGSEASLSAESGGSAQVGNRTDLWGKLEDWKKHTKLPLSQVQRLQHGPCTILNRLLPREKALGVTLEQEVLHYPTQSSEGFGPRGYASNHARILAALLTAEG